MKPKQEQGKNISGYYFNKELNSWAGGSRLSQQKPNCSLPMFCSEPVYWWAAHARATAAHSQCQSTGPQWQRAKGSRCEHHFAAEARHQPPPPATQVISSTSPAVARPPESAVVHTCNCGSVTNYDTKPESRWWSPGGTAEVRRSWAPPNHAQINLPVQWDHQKKMLQIKQCVTGGNYQSLDHLPSPGKLQVHCKL